MKTKKTEKDAKPTKDKVTKGENKNSKGRKINEIQIKREIKDRRITPSSLVNKVWSKIYICKFLIFIEIFLKSIYDV